MKVKNALDVSFDLTATWGNFVDDGDLSVIFTINIEGTKWKEFISYYPILDELYYILQATPIASEISAPGFPSELLDNYSYIAEIIQMPVDERKPTEEHLLHTVLMKVEEFIVGQLANIAVIPAEARCVCKQIFFRSVHKIQVFDCLLGHSWLKKKRTPTFRQQHESKDVVLLKKVLGNKTEADLLRDALEGVRAEMALLYEGVSIARKDELAVDISLDNANMRVSVLSSRSPLVNMLSNSPQADYAEQEQELAEAEKEAEEVDLTSLGLTKLDVIGCMQELRQGIACNFLLPDKQFRGRLCAAVLMLPPEINVVDIALTISASGSASGSSSKSNTPRHPHPPLVPSASVSGPGSVYNSPSPSPSHAAGVAASCKTTRLVYDITEDVGLCQEGKGPTLLSLPSDVAVDRVLHILLHNRPELNLVAVDERQRNKMLAAINRITSASRCSVQMVTRQSVAASTYIHRMSVASSNPSSRESSWQVAEGSVRQGSGRASLPPMSPRPSIPPHVSIQTTQASAPAPISTPAPTPQPAAAAETAAAGSGSSYTSFFSSLFTSSAPPTPIAAPTMPTVAPIDIPMEESKEEGQGVQFSVPMKVEEFCWGHLGSKGSGRGGDPLGVIGSSRSALRDKLPVDMLQQQPLKLLLVTSMLELLVFSLPDGWNMQHEGVREMNSIVRKLIQVPFPVSLLDKKQLVCERVIFVPGISYIDEKEETVLIQTEDETLSLFVENVQVRINLMSSLIHHRKAGAKSLRNTQTLQSTGSGNSGSGSGNARQSMVMYSSNPDSKGSLHSTPSDDRRGSMPQLNRQQPLQLQIPAPASA